MVFIHVRTPDGRALSGVHVALSGAASRESTTDFEGVVRLQSMADGAYHLRFEREGFIAFEQDLALKRGQPDLIDVTLAAAPPPEPAPPPPPPPPAPEPAPPPPPSSAAVASTPADREQKIVSIPDFVARNFIGKEGVKESTLGCTGTTMTRLLQIRNPIPSHLHEDVDEVLYVVAGEGAIIVSERSTMAVGPGALDIIPRGVAHSIERRGKNPLILLSTLAGAPCAAGGAK